MQLLNISFNMCLFSCSDWLRTGRSGDRIPVGLKLSTPVQTGPEFTQPPVWWEPRLYRG